MTAKEQQDIFDALLRLSDVINESVAIPLDIRHAEAAKVLALAKVINREIPRG